MPPWTVPISRVLAPNCHHAAPAVLAARLAARADHFTPPQLLGSQLDALQLPDAEPDVIVVDATGPLAQVLERLIAALRPAC
jgi:gluconokinase